MHMHPEYLETSEDSNKICLHQEVLTNKNIAVIVTTIVTTLPTILRTHMLKATNYFKIYK